MKQEKSQPGAARSTFCECRQASDNTQHFGTLRFYIKTPTIFELLDGACFDMLRMDRLESTQQTSGCNTMAELSHLLTFAWCMNDQYV